MTIKVSIQWTYVSADDDPLWQLGRGLYAYLSPDFRKEILYIGKTDGTTIRQRWNSPDKDILWDFIEQKLGYRKHILLVGEIEMGLNHRLSCELLTDIESLLIRALQPCGNIQSKNSRIERSGLHIICHGDWPGQVKRFYDGY
jgi:hypothetical protein